MANAFARLIVNPWPDGVDATTRRLAYDGVCQIVAGNYPAGGLPILWSLLLVADPTGQSAQLETIYQNPVYALFNGYAGLYDYTYQGVAQSASGLSYQATNVAVTASVATVLFANLATNPFSLNQQVNLNGFVGASFLNGLTVTITSITASGNVVAIQFASPQATYSSTADTGQVYSQPILPNPIYTVTAFSISSNVATFTCANNFVAGQYITLTGFQIGTYFNNQTVQVISTGLSGTQFEANFTHANVSATTEVAATAFVQYDFLHINPQSGVTNAAATSTQIAITSNVATVTATNTFTAGETVLLQAFTTGTYFNGQIVTIASATGSAYTFNFTHANVSTTADTTGTATRTDITAGSAVPAAVLNDVIAFHCEFAKS